MSSHMEACVVKSYKIVQPLIRNNLTSLYGAQPASQIRCSPRTGDWNLSQRLLSQKARGL